MISIVKLNDFIWIMSSGFLPNRANLASSFGENILQSQRGRIEKDSVDVSFNKKERDYDFVGVYIFD